MKGRFKDLADGWPKEISFFLTSDQTVHIQFPELPDTVVPLVSVAEQTNWKEEPKMYDSNTRMQTVEITKQFRTENSNS